MNELDCHYLVDEIHTVSVIAFVQDTGGHGGFRYLLLKLFCTVLTICFKKNLKKNLTLRLYIIQQMGFEILLVLAVIVRGNKWKMPRKRKGVPKDGEESTQSLQDAPNDDSSSTQSLKISKKQKTGVALILSRIEELSDKIEKLSVLQRGT